MKNQTNLNDAVDAFMFELKAVIVPPLERMVEVLSVVLNGIAMKMRAERESAERHQMRKWLSQVPHGGIIGDEAFLIVYNEEAPELSYIIKEQIEV